MKLLLVSYHYDNGTAEGLVTAKLARGLAARGHEVTALASGAPGVGQDAGVDLHRVEAAPGPGWWRTLDRRRAHPVLGRIAAIPNLVHGCSVQEWGWATAVAQRALDIQEESGCFDLLHTRLNHFVSHLAGLEIVRRTGLPWCAYFSDPWPHHLYPEPYRFTIGPLSRRRLEKLLEKILRRSGSSVWPTERLRDHMLRGRRAGFVERAFVAPHVGPSWNGPRPALEKGTLVLRHAGFLMKERRIDSLLGGLRMFRERWPSCRLRVEFAGRYPGGAPPEPPEDLHDMVSFLPSLPAREAWDWLRGAHVLLLVEAGMAEGIFFPSKLSDYLAAARPILSLSPRVGVVADWLGGGGGIVVDPGDAPGIAAALEWIYDLWNTDRLEELAPGPDLVRAVSAEAVLPVYERAFERAMKAAR